MATYMKRAGAIDAGTHRCKYDQDFTTWIESSRDLFVQFDRDYRILYANPGFCRCFGFSQEATAGADFDRLGVKREIAVKWKSLLGRVFDEGKERSDEIGLPTQSGLRYFRIRVAPEFGDGKIESVWASGREIKEIRGAQSILGDTEARFKALVSNVPGLVFQMSLRKLDHSLEFYYLSDGAIALCGMTPERIQRNPGDFIDLIHHDDLAAFHHSMMESLDTLGNWKWEGRLSESANGERWVSLQATPRRMNTGSVLWDGIVLDITDSKRNVESLRVSEESLRDLCGLCVRAEVVREEEKQAISREIHDELGQLLTALKMDLSCMREVDDLNSYSRTKVQRMESLADDILHRVRDIASTLRPKVLELGLAPAIEWLTQEFTYHTGAICRLSLEGLELCEGLDSTRTTAIFRIVQESLTNITRHANARKVEISFVNRERCLHLSIHDDGIGFDPAIVQVSKIGLSGIRDRAAILGADLQIDSSAKAGTTLKVRIPAESFSSEHRAKARSENR